MPLTISVVTPSYNQGQFIERTICSVLSQGVAGLDYMVCDGGSTDETVHILKRYETQLRWISEPDRGQAAAVNKGFRATAGDVLGWLNSDDVYYPGAIQAVCAYFETHPEVDVVYGDAHHIDEQDRVIESYPTESWNIERLKEVCYLSQPAVFLRRRVVERLGMLDEHLRYCMDYGYWLRLAAGGARFAHLPRLLAGSRLHAATKTLGSRLQVHREINDMMRLQLGRVPTRWLFNYAHAVMDDWKVSRHHRLRFSCGVSLLSWYAALRWNRRLSKELIQTTARWILSGFRALTEVP
jgi:glycosyltransferase involved in cell wall biosynthesis